jgi:hypothetical protein
MSLTIQMLESYCNQWVNYLETQKDNTIHELDPSKSIEDYFDKNYFEICRLPKAKSSLEKLNATCKSVSLVKLVDLFNGREGPISTVPLDMIKLIIEYVGNVKFLGIALRVSKTWNKASMAMLKQDRWLNAMNQAYLIKKSKFDLDFLKRYTDQQSKLTVNMRTIRTVIEFKDPLDSLIKQNGRNIHSLTVREYLWVGETLGKKLSTFCPNMIELDLSHSTVQLEGLEGLKLPKLEKLIINNDPLPFNPIYEITLQSLLKNCPKIQVLDIRGFSAQNVTSFKFLEQNQLTHLMISHASFTDSEAIRIWNYKEIRYLSLRGSFLLTDAFLKGAPSDSKMEFLDLTGATLNSVGLRNLSHCQNLHTLCLTMTTVDEKAAAALASIPKLQNLTLTGVNKFGTDCVLQFNFAKVCTIKFTNTTINPEQLRALKVRSYIKIAD